MTLALTLTRRFWPRATMFADLLLVVAGSAIVAALAQVSIPLPPSPVPITGQTFAVLLVGAALGSRRGAASLALYLVEGSLGLPVFAEGKAGLAVLLGPTGGYLAGFIAAAYVVGYLAERGLDRRWVTALIPFLLGEAVIYLFGLPRLAAFVGVDNVLAFGLWPYLLGDAIKLILAAIAFPAGWALVKRLERS
jgi:biotin transport system substrate-specific component